MSKILFLGADRFLFQNAKALLNTPTATENLLWGYLNGNQLGSNLEGNIPWGFTLSTSIIINTN